MSTSSALQNSLALLNEIKGQLNQAKTVPKQRNSSRLGATYLESPSVVSRDVNRPNTS